MECPRPQPGQNENPKNLKMHKEKCPLLSGFIVAKSKRETIQKRSSKFLFRISQVKRK
jgi:hypothetical protein